MLDYQKAPYIELEDYKAPKGINAIYIPMKDGKRIRLIYWRNIEPIANSRGTILLQQGHNEFIEKYFETIQELLERNFNVVSFDWRGQGMSDKMTTEKHKQFIEDFRIHDEDLHLIIESIINKNFPKPLIGIGHSMGGCLMLSALKKNGKKFHKMILSAPMLGFKNEILLMPLIFFSNIFSSKNNFVIGSKPNMGKETPFKGNDLTSDQRRYLRTQQLVRKNNDIRLWGITNAWAKATKDRLNLIRKTGWAESIDNNILFINSLNDKVVSPKRIISMAKRLKNSKIVNFESCEHEIFMENDNHRKKMWNEIDNFLEI